MGRPKSELLVATAIIGGCAILLAVLPASSTTLELSKKKRTLWLIEHSSRQSELARDATSHADTRFVQRLMDQRLTDQRMTDR